MAEKILIVEDELTLQETLAYNLRHHGYEVETAGNGQVVAIKNFIFRKRTNAFLMTSRIIETHI